MRHGAAASYQWFRAVFSAQDHGAWAFRGVEVGGLLRDGDRVTGATGHNSITLQPYTVRADCVVNAAGAWAGRLAALAGVEIVLAPNKGTLVAMARRPVTHVLNHCRPPADGDIIVPNGAGVVLGTTAVPTADPDDDAVPEGEPARLLEEAIRMVPVLREVETVRSWAAIRPLALAEGPQPARAADPAGRASGRDYLLVDHEERDGVGGLITVIGGKVTTARRMAQAASDLVCDKLGVVEPCRTADEPLPGAASARH